MKPITKEEIQAILDSGVTKNFIEKKLGMGQGSIGKFLTGKLNNIPEKYVSGIRKIGKDIVITNEKLIEGSTKLLKELDEREIKLDGIIPEVKYLDEREVVNTKIGDDVVFDNIQDALNAEPTLSDECSITPKDMDEIMEHLNATIKRPKINKDLLP
jgi:hypothetical protein